MTPVDLVQLVHVDGCVSPSRLVRSTIDNCSIEPHFSFWIQDDKSQEGGGRYLRRYFFESSTLARSTSSFSSRTIESNGLLRLVDTCAELSRISNRWQARTNSRWHHRPSLRVRDTPTQTSKKVMIHSRVESGIRVFRPSPPPNPIQKKP